MAKDLKLDMKCSYYTTFYPLLALKFHGFVGVVLGNQVFKFMFIWRCCKCHKVYPMFNGNQSPQTAKYQDLKSAMQQMLQAIRVKVFQFQSATQMVMDFLFWRRQNVLFFCSVLKHCSGWMFQGFHYFEICRGIACSAMIVLDVIVTRIVCTNIHPDM